MKIMKLLDALENGSRPGASGDVSRRDLLSEGSQKAVALALAAVPALTLATARKAYGQELPQSVVDVLNFALTLEYLEAEFYVQGVDSGVVASADLGIFQAIHDHENAHVAFLQSALGDAAVSKPTFDFTAGGAFPDVFTNYQTFLALSQGFEDTGVRAYKGGAGALMDNDAILTAALQIHSVEARHASVVRRIRGNSGWIPGDGDETELQALQPVYAGEGNTVHAGLDATGVTNLGTEIVTEAFDEPLSVSDVLAIVDPFIEGN